MPIQLRCPGCGKVYRLADDRAGKQAKCPCGAVIKVPAAHSKDGPAWEDEVNLAFGPPAASQPQETEQGCHAHVSVGMDDTHGHEDAAMQPHPAAAGSGDPRPTSGKNRPADTPSSLFSRIAAFARVDLRRLVKKDRWRAAVGLTAVAYGTVAAPLILSGATFRSLSDVMFGSTTWSLAQGAMAIAIAYGGMLILKEDKRGPGYAGLAAGLFCFVPVIARLVAVVFYVLVTWRLPTSMGDELAAQGFLSLLWLVAEYAIPVALMVWCLKEETRAKGESSQ